MTQSSAIYSKLDRDYGEEDPADEAPQARAEMRLTVIGAASMAVVFVVFSILLATHFTHPRLLIKNGERFHESSTVFELSSTVLDDGGDLPISYTCYGKKGGKTVPLDWTNSPKSTQQYLLLLSTRELRSKCNRYDWVLYNIDSDVSSITAGNTKHVGTVGGTWPSKSVEAQVPCPQGRGTVSYTYTLYALNGDIRDLVDRLDDDYYRDLGPELLIQATKSKMVIDSASLTVSYHCAEDDCPGSSDSRLNRQLAAQKSDTGSGVNAWFRWLRGRESSGSGIDREFRRLGGHPLVNTDDEGACIEQMATDRD